MDAPPFPPPRRTTVRLEGGAMSMLDFGDPARPPDIVFAHANGFNATTYRGVLGPLGASLRVWAVDLRGHGESTLPADPRRHRSWEVHARDLAMLLAGVEGARRPPVLSGHSMGGTSMLLAAARAPERARRLVLFDPVLLPRWQALYARTLPGRLSLRRIPLATRAAARRSAFESREAAFAAYSGRGAFRSWPADTLADYVEGGFRDAPGGGVELTCAPAWEAANFSAQGADPYRALARLDRPVAILKAEHGSTCNADPAWLKARGVKLKTVPGSSHFLPMERPDVVRQFLVDAVEAP